MSLPRQNSRPSNYSRAKVFWDSEDRQLEDAGPCGLRQRPDFLVDAGTHFVVLEVDEHQHRDRACECEMVRMVNLTHALQLPTVFVRFNPDAYLPAPGTGDEVPVRARYDELLRVLRHRRDTRPDLPEGGCCGVVYLYYDGDHSSEHCVMHVLA